MAPAMAAGRRKVGGYRTAGRTKPDAATSTRMQAIRQKGTEPELRVRRLLTRAGLRYRICPADLPGRPDLANKSKRWAVFVHGCFWHAHPNCRLATVPKMNRAFWIEKLTANRARDATKAQALRKLGYKVVTVWQCELDDPRLPQTLVRRLTSSTPRQS
jgi:DNA mismatch endonuclease (patch repair protein)